jgi:phosphohistidine swiveling domain-containing protein
VVGGSAWKMEGALARFYRQHLAATVNASVQELLVGLPGSRPELAAHAVQSIDWYHPTAGELGWAPRRPSEDRRRELAARREALSAQCLAVLGDRPQLQARFQALLEVAQRYAVLREQQARQLTLGWPLLRRCVLRLGEILRTDGVIDRAEDVFFLTRAELDSRAPLQDVVDRRRATWERQRRLLAPLTIGRPPRLIQRELLTTVEAVRTGPVPHGAIVGQPASPGRATGPVRVVHGPGDFDRFQPGEVLVARATTPACTPLFARTAAVVTDGGTLAAHASLVAREYGIPAVVATGDATTRLADGQVVTVDGSAGTVRPPE